MSAFNSDLKINYQIVLKNKALHYCLKNSKFNKNSDKSGFRKYEDVKLK